MPSRVIDLSLAIEDNLPGATQGSLAIAAKAAAAYERSCPSGFNLPPCEPSAA